MSQRAPAIRGNNQQPNLAIVQDQSSSIAMVSNSDHADLIRQTYAKDLAPVEFELFVAHADRMQASIIDKEIYAVVRTDKKTGKRQLTFMLAIDWYRRRTEKHPLFAGLDGPYFCGKDMVWHQVWVASEPPVAAKFGIYRKGFPNPVEYVARYDEYAPTWFDQNSGTTKVSAGMYQKMPTNQLGIRAEMQCHRRAFPSLYRGIVEEAFADTDTGFAFDTDASRQRISGVVYASDEDAEAFRKSELRRTHAAASKMGFSHDDLSTFALGMGADSLGDLTAEDLTNLRESIKNQPIEARRHLEQMRSQAVVIDPDDPRDDDDSWQQQFERFKKIATELGLTDDDFRRQAEFKGAESIDQFDESDIRQLADGLEQYTQHALTHFKRLRDREELARMNAELNAIIDGDQGQPIDVDADEDGVIQGSLLDSPIAHPGHGDS